MPCCHINEETCPLASVNTQKPLQLEGETCLPRTNHDKNHPSLELQERTTHKTKSTQVGMVMITSTNVQTPLTKSTMLTQWCENCRAEGGRI
jgi:hypothetical protein